MLWWLCLDMNSNVLSDDTEQLSQAIDETDSDILDLLNEVEVAILLISNPGHEL